MDARQLGRTELTEMVAAELGLAPGSDKVRRWLANDTVLDAHAIRPLAHAVGEHPLAMLAAYGLVDNAPLTLALQVGDYRRQILDLQERLVERYQQTGAALFVEQALRAGSWNAAVFAHWRGRRLPYHFADYVLLEPIRGRVSQDEASQVFADAFAATGAEWDDAPFAGEPIAAGNQLRVFVPRLAAVRPARPWRADLGQVRGIVVAGPKWAGMYSVSALLSRALGWGHASFDYMARTIDGTSDSAAATSRELMREWLGNPAQSPAHVFAHVLGEQPADADVRLLAAAPPEIAVFLLLPEERPIAPTGVDEAARLGGVEPAKLRSSLSWWREAIPERSRVAHVVTPTPVGRDGTPVTREQPGFLDGYLDASAEAALRVLTLLAAPAPVASVIPAQALTDQFARLAAAH